MAVAEHSASLNPHVTTEIADKSVDSHGRKTLNQYTFLSLLSRGTLCKVKLAQYANDDASRVAVKIYSRQRLKRSTNGLGCSPFIDIFAREVAHMRALGNHENIVQLREYICQPNIDKVYLVLEYLRGGPCIGAWDKNTASFVGGGLREEESRHMLRDVLAGLCHMHKMRIAHGDIKPANILRSGERESSSASNPRFAICDLASAKQYTAVDIGSVRETSTLGKTYAFFSPEMCGAGNTAAQSARDAGDCIISYSPFQADLWAVGVTLFAASSGKLPFWDDRGGQPLFDAILHKDIQYDNAMSPELCSLLSEMLDRSGKRSRGEVASIPQIQEHPWVTGIARSDPNSPVLHSRHFQWGCANVATLIRGNVRLFNLLIHFVQHRYKL